MEPVRFVHAADLHLDSPFQGVSEVAPHIAAELREATFAAYERIIDLCIERQVDALLVAGDVYDGADRSLTAQLRFQEGLRRLDRHGIRSFICHGNHDPLDGWSAGLHLPESCVRFGTEVAAAPLTADGRAVVYGISYPTAAVREDLSARFRPEGEHEFSIGLLHCNVESRAGHGNYAPATLAGLAESGIDYWALGHVHTRQVLRAARPAVVYPGNPQGLDVTETGQRGVYIVEVAGPGRIQLEFAPTCGIQWARLGVDIAAIESEQELLDQLASAVTAVREAAAGCHLIYRLSITGMGPLHQALQKDLFLHECRAELNRSFGSGARFVWCDQLEATTLPEFDRAARLGAGDFLAEVLGILDELRVDPAAPHQLRKHLAPLFDHHRLLAYEEDLRLSDAELVGLLDEVERRIVTEFLDAP